MRSNLRLILCILLAWALMSPIVSTIQAVKPVTDMAAGASRPAINSGDRPEMVPARVAAPNINPERRRIAQLAGLLMGTAEFQRR